MNKLTAEKCREQFEAWYWNEFGQFEDGGWLECFAVEEGEYYRLGSRMSWAAWQASRQALEIALPVPEQQEKGDDGRNKMLSMPAMVTAQDMRETLNILLHEEEAEAAATGFNQCLMECAPIYEAYIRRSRCIDELVKELDGMQDSLNAKHRRFVAQRNRAEAAEAKLAELAPQPATNPQIDNDGWIEWKGGNSAEIPVDEAARVELRYSNGSTSRGRASNFGWENRVASGYHSIIAYRVIGNDGREG